VGPVTRGGPSLYEALGEGVFRALVDAFYRRVEADPELRRIFPPDLTEGREKQFLFLTQLFGGPARYTEQHGDPRLRFRHLPFAIGRAERDRWVDHMHAAIAEVAIPEPSASVLREYFDQFSLHMINR